MLYGIDMSKGSIDKIQSQVRTFAKKPQKNLASIRGIGKKTKDKLFDYYQNEQTALRSIQLGLVGMLPGISYKQATNFSLAFLEECSAISIDHVLKTPDIRIIYDKIISLAKDFAKTEYSQERLHYYFPLPSKELELIKQRREYFDKAQKYVQSNPKLRDQPRFSHLLQNLNSIKLEIDANPVNSRIIVSESKKALREVKKIDLEGNLSIEKFDFDDPLKLADRFQGYSENFEVVIYTGENYSKVPDLSNVVFIPQKDLSCCTVFPEKIVEFFSENTNLIDAMIEIAVVLQKSNQKKYVTSFLEMIKEDKLARIKKNREILSSKGEIKKGIEPKLDEFRKIEREFLNLVGEREALINDTIENEIGKRSIEISGKKILDLFQSDLAVESLRDYIPEEVNDFIMDTIFENLEKLKKELKLEPDEYRYLNQLEPEIIEYPIQFNEEGVSGLQHRISARSNVIRYEILTDIAENLEDLKDFVLSFYETLLQFEFFYTIGKFAENYNLRSSHLIEDNLESIKKRGFFGKDMKNLDLQSAPDAGSVEPIRYQIGSINPLGIKDIHIKDNKTSQLNLLTGSNSGGKTKCLQSCAQSIILAQMGFPTLGDFYLFPFDEMYYFKKSSGQISAGAFETTLLQFVDMAQSPKLKVIFADELESITEPNAASKVIAGIFSLLLDKKTNYGIFVTHLVEFIKSELSSEEIERIRFDGIEASGLDDGLNLIVDRNPKYNFIARSTPELILSRLSKLGDGKRRQFFSSLLNKF